MSWKWVSRHGGRHGALSPGVQRSITQAARSITKACIARLFLSRMHAPTEAAGLTSVQGLESEVRSLK